MEKFNGSLIRQFPSLITGNAAAGVGVSVCELGTNNLVTIYGVNDENSTPIPNPVVTDQKGFYSFYVPDGKYTLKFSNGFPAIEINMLDAAAWAAIIADVGGVLFEQQPKKQGPVSISSLTGGLMTITEFSYVPGQDRVMVFANGSKLELGADYTESSSTTITLTADYLSAADPSTRIEAWSTDIVPTNNIKASSVSYVGAYPNVQKAIEGLLENVSSEFVTLEEFDTSAGTGGDDTTAFEQACAASFAQNKPIQLLNKTYRLKPIPIGTSDGYKIKGGIYGMGRDLTFIESADNTGVATDFLLLPFVSLSNLVFQDFSYDCGLSADPTDPAGWAAGYDSFTGSRGFYFEDIENLTVQRINATNVMRAGVSTHNVRKCLIDSVNTTRTRGNFGDGIYVTGRDVLVTNCHVEDYTRIAFVIETNTSQPYLSQNIVFMECSADYGHDGSILYGGAESNVGYWFENFVSAAIYKCETKNHFHRGCTIATNYREGLADQFPDTLYADVTIDSLKIIGADTGGYGVTVNTLRQDLRPSVTINNCIGENQEVFIQVNNFEDDRQNVTINNTHATTRLMEANNTSFLLHLGGSVTVTDSTLQYKTFNRAFYDAEDNNSAPFSRFSTQTGTNLYVERFKTLDPDRVELPTKIKMNSANSRARTKVRFKDMYMTQVENKFKEARFEDVLFERIGTVVADTVIYERCKILDTYFGTDPEARTPVFKGGSTGKIGLYDCEFDFVDSGGYLYLYNGENTLSSENNIEVVNGRFKKDFAIDGPAIRISASTTVKNTSGVNNYKISDSEFINTGAATTNPIIRSDMSTEANPAIINGMGNVKSPTLSVNVGINAIQNFDIKATNATVAEPVAITASRDLLLSDINREVTNATSSAVVLTLTAGTNGALPIGTQLTLARQGTGTIAFTPTAPTTVNGTTTFAGPAQYSSVRVRKVGANAWVTV